MHLVLRLGSLRLVLEPGRLRGGNDAVAELRKLRNADANLQLELRVGRVRQLLRAGRVRARADVVAGLRQLRHPVADVHQQLHLARIRVLRGSRRLLAGLLHGLRDDHELPRKHGVVQQQLPVGSVHDERVLALRSPGRVCAR